MTFLNHTHNAHIGTGISGGIAGLVERARDNMARNALYRRTVSELSNLSDRELSDLGIGRGMITRIAHEAAWGK